jgi:protein-S-isoprenylcysteine O-methyltransferase Ste14
MFLNNLFLYTKNAWLTESPAESNVKGVKDMDQMFFHLVFVVVFITFALIRAVYQKRTEGARRRADFKEGKLLNLFRLAVGLPFMALVLAYLVWPGLLDRATFPLPTWAQWAGVGLGLASLPLIVWVHEALGRNFSTTLHVRDEHTLVTRGPYRWVRHPMYTVLYIHFLAVLLLTRNWLVGGVFLLAMTLIIAQRLKHEEATMIEKFGDAYRDYMRRTGRFLPRLPI